MKPYAWELLYVLDSLDLQAPFETDYLVFVGRRDQRVVSSIAKHPATATLLDGFTDTAGREKSVTALLLREDAPPIYRQEVVIRSVRNVFAISSVISGSQAHLLDLNGRGFRVLYSSFFRFYPIQVSRDGRQFLTDTFAFRNVDDVSNFRGQVSPDLPHTSLVDPRPDPMLGQRLTEAWKSMVARPDDPKSNALFRSLDIAFNAALVPATQSVYEMGIRLGLWVRAFEILAHAHGGRANLDKVLDLLALVSWKDRELGRDCVTERGRPRALVAGLYADLYKARNDYVHGNPVVEERPYTFKDRQLPLLLWMAPLIYKAALNGYLAWLGYPLDETQLLFQQPEWEEALLKAMPASTVKIA